MGHKQMDTDPTIVAVEFLVPEVLVEMLMAWQCKVEDGAISMDLGNKASKGLTCFNAASQHPPAAPATCWIILAKRKATWLAEECTMEARQIVLAALVALCQLDHQPTGSS